MSMQRTVDEEERIQMHADKLYHEMLGREKTMKEAEEQNRGLDHLSHVNRNDCRS